MFNFISECRLKKKIIARKRTSKQHGFRMKTETGIQVSRDQDIILVPFLGVRDVGHVLNDGQMNILYIIKRLHFAISNNAYVYFPFP